MTILAAADATNNTPSPQTTSADRCLKCFIEQVTKARQSPLLELSDDDAAHGRRAPPALPKRRWWIAVQSMSHIPASKRGEHLLLKRLGLTSEMSPPSTSAMKVYEEIFSDNPGNMQVLRELFPPDGDVGARKRCRR